MLDFFQPDTHAVYIQEDPEGFAIATCDDLDNMDKYVHVPFEGSHQECQQYILDNPYDDFLLVVPPKELSSTRGPHLFSRKEWIEDWGEEGEVICEGDCLACCLELEYKWGGGW